MPRKRRGFLDARKPAPPCLKQSLKAGGHSKGTFWDIPGRPNQLSPPSRSNPCAEPVGAARTCELVGDDLSLGDGEALNEGREF